MQSVEEYLPYVRSIAKKYCRRLPRHVEFDDIYSSGVLGLVRAVNRFDASKNIPFAAYAQLLIRGAITDSLRQQDWAPRHLRARAKRTGETLQCFVPMPEEFELPVKHEDALGKLIIRQAIDRLDDRARRVVHMYYFEGLLMTEIAERIGTTSGNVCWFLREARVKLQAIMEPARR